MKLLPLLMLLCLLYRTSAGGLWGIVTFASCMGLCNFIGMTLIIGEVALTAGTAAPLVPAKVATLESTCLGTCTKLAMKATLSPVP